MATRPKKESTPKEYGRCISRVDYKGVKRSTVLYRMEKGFVKLDWRTWWNDPNDTPTENSVMLSPEALNDMMQLLAQLTTFPHEFPVCKFAPPPVPPVKE